MSESKKSSIYETLSALEKEYGEKLKSLEKKPLKLEKMSYEAKSDDELTAAVAGSLEQKYGKKSQDLTEEASQKKESLSVQVENLINEAEKEEAARKLEYDEAQKNLENQAMKRSVQRSSIAIDEIGKLEGERLKESADYAERIKSDVSAIENKISGLEEGLNASLKALDMKKAIESAEEIDKLKKEREEKLAEALKYNNSALEKETKYNNELSEESVKEQEEKLNAEFAKKKMSAVLNYYLAMPDAKEAFEQFAGDDNLSEQLGKYYKYCYNTLKSRA